MPSNCPVSRKAERILIQIYENSVSQRFGRTFVNETANPIVSQIDDKNSPH